MKNILTFLLVFLPFVVFSQTDTTKGKMLVRRCKVCQSSIIEGYVVTDKNCNVLSYLDRKRRLIPKDLIIDYYLIKEN